jgi:hypothetical protein
MKQTTTTKGIYFFSLPSFISISLQSQEKVQQKKLSILNPETIFMKTIVTLILCFFIQVIAFSQVTSFAGKLNNNRIDLKWATASEKNVSHFVIEKSIDGKDYSEAGIVFAYGNTSETMNYPFIDKNINADQAGAIYYRLKAVANDGKIEVSQVATIRIEKRNEQTINSVNSSNQAGTDIAIHAAAL